MKRPDVGEILEITKQYELWKIRDVLDYDPVSELKLQFAPQSILDEDIQTEMRNNGEQNVFQELSIKSLAGNSKVISYHQFFNVKCEGDEQNLSMKWFPCSARQSRSEKRIHPPRLIHGLVSFHPCAACTSNPFQFFFPSVDNSPA